jgi:hypothetical protein
MEEQRRDTHLSLEYLIFQARQLIMTRRKNQLGRLQFVRRLLYVVVRQEMLALHTNFFVELPNREVGG